MEDRSFFLWQHWVIGYTATAHRQNHLTASCQRGMLSWMFCFRSTQLSTPTWDIRPLLSQAGWPAGLHIGGICCNHLTVQLSISSWTCLGVRTYHQQLVKHFVAEGVTWYPSLARRPIVSPHTQKVICRQVRANPKSTTQQIKETNLQLLGRVSSHCLKHCSLDNLKFKSCHACKFSLLHSSSMMSLFEWFALHSEITADVSSLVVILMAIPIGSTMGKCLWYV